MQIHDYRVSRKTRDDLEHEAARLRSEWGLKSSDTLDVYELLFGNMPPSLQKLGLKMVERRSGFMGERAAYAAPKSRRIFYRGSLLAQLRLGVPDAAVIFLHELVHILLHRGAGEKAWIISGNKTPAFIEEEESAEHQATTLALCLKAPKEAAINCVDKAELGRRFGLGDEHAAARFEMVSRQRRRSLPASYYRFKGEVLQKSSSPNNGLKLPIAETSYLNEPCSYCGRKLLRPSSSKYWCDGCKNYSDQFQDGDLVSFGPW